MQDSGASAPRERGVMSLWRHCERSEAIQKSLREDILDCFVRFAPRNDERCLTSESEVAPQTGAADIEDIERCEFRLNPSAHRLAPTADTTSPVPPVGSPLPPATPTAVTAAHVAVRTDGRRFNCQSRLRCSRQTLDPIAATAAKATTAPGRIPIRTSRRLIARTVSAPAFESFSSTLFRRLAPRSSRRAGQLPSRMSRSDSNIRSQPGSHVLRSVRARTLVSKSQSLAMRPAEPILMPRAIYNCFR